MRILLSACSADAKDAGHGDDGAGCDCGPLDRRLVSADRPSTPAPLRLVEAGGRPAAQIFKPSKPDYARDLHAHIGLWSYLLG